jgi:hypothetical protein
LQANAQVASMAQIAFCRHSIPTHAARALVEERRSTVTEMSTPAGLSGMQATR